MIKHRRSGYSLLYLLAAIPLAAIVGNMTAKVLSGSLRAQTIATYQVTNYTETVRLVRQLQDDTGKAISAELTDSDSSSMLKLKLPEKTIVYSAGGQKVSRTVMVDNTPGTVITWDFKKTSIRFSKERINDARDLIWIKLDFSFTFENGIKQKAADSGRCTRWNRRLTVKYPQTRQKGVLLVIVVGAMAILGGVITVITGHAASYHQQRNNDQLYSCLQFATDSAVAYAKNNLPLWIENTPTSPISLDINDLLPPKMKGTATFIFDKTQGDANTCHIKIKLQRHRIGKSKDVYIPLTKPDAVDSI